MRSLRIALFTFFAGIALWSAAKAGGRPGEFDYYTLVLSWSPTYCETAGRDDRGPQCNGGRPYAFVLHGLWPQYERGWPDYCRMRERPWVPERLIDQMLDIMPSPKLVIHEYKKHGTCTGLLPEAYYATARKLYESIRIPERFITLERPIYVSPSEVESAFLAANPQLKPEMISISCGRKRLREVRICFTKDLKPRECGPNETQRRLCRLEHVLMPPVRRSRPGH